jgi:hypothetical protein
VGGRVGVVLDLSRPLPAACAQEIVEWLAKPENLQADALPPFIESFDAAPYLSSALPLAASVLAINLAHEAVQRAVASLKGVRLPRASHCTCMMLAL